MTDYKMIVLDLDDTLLQDDMTVSPRTRDALIAIQKQGKKVVLASGRPQFAMHHIAKELQLDVYESYILSFNGGMIIDCKTKEIIYNQGLEPQSVHKLFDLAKQENTYIHTYTESELVTNIENPYTKKSSEITGMPIRVSETIKEDISIPVGKVLLGNDPSVIEELEKKWSKELADEFSVARSKPYFLEVTKKGINKGATLQYLLNMLHIKREEVIACGDSFNDIDLITFAGLGVAMGNAHPRVKEKADFITASNNEDGIALVVEKFM